MSHMTGVQKAQVLSLLRQLKMRATRSVSSMATNGRVVYWRYEKIVLLGLAEGLDGGAMEDSAAGEDMAAGALVVVVALVAVITPVTTLAVVIIRTVTRMMRIQLICLQIHLRTLQLVEATEGQLYTCET